MSALTIITDSTAAAFENTDHIIHHTYHSEMFGKTDANTMCNMYYPHFFTDKPFAMAPKYLNFVV